MRIQLPADVPQWAVALAQSIQNYVDYVTGGLFVRKTRMITAGTGLSGGGDLSADRTISLTLVLAAGTYTPTLTNTTNIAASTAYPCQYLRVGSVVTVSGKVDVDPTLVAASALGISLPIASILASSENCSGVAASNAIASEVAAIDADTSNNRAKMDWVTTSLANHSMYFSFTYLIT